MLGCGRHLPSRVVTNEDLARSLGVPAERIAEQTGITRRHWAEAGQGPSDLAREAALAALAQCGIEPSAIDLIVFATMTPDITFPGSGCFLQDKLGCDTVGALDVRAQCAGFLFALATAERFVRAGKARRVLVAGAEVHSSALDCSPRGAGVTPRFGDGAGVVIVGDVPGPGVLSMVLHSDPTGLERFWCEFPSSRHWPVRIEAEYVRAGRHFYAVDATVLDTQAEQSLAEVIGEALGQAGMGPDEPALALVHYLDPRVARRAAERAGLAGDRVVATAEAAGHIAAGGLPIALADALAAGRVGHGDRVLCAAFGSGMSWGGTVLRLA